MRKESAHISLFSQGLIWSGAALSIAEILTGVLIAPLGWGRGAAAIVIGHAVGCAVLYLAGLIGGSTGKTAMETVKLSFGCEGGRVFAGLNVLQLTGWTAVMIASAAAAAGSLADLGGSWQWPLLVAGLIALWILIGLDRLGWVNGIAMAALFILTLLLSVKIFGHGGGETGGEISFGAAVELSAAMPLSWLPLISDYTCRSQRGRTASAIGAGVYFLVSCWMFLIGMGAALLTGAEDIAAILLTAGLGASSLLIVIFSTVTTTFLDAYSAGVSSSSLWAKLPQRGVALAVCGLGAILAIAAPSASYESFLYLIGSVFAPMTAIMLCDFFLLRRDNSGRSIDRRNLLLWLAGFVIYRLFLTVDTPVGATLPAMVVTAGLCLGTDKIYKRRDENHVQRNLH